MIIALLHIIAGIGLLLFASNASCDVFGSDACLAGTEAVIHYTRDALLTFIQ